VFMSGTLMIALLVFFYIYDSGDYSNHICRN
jgi:hypothetical protein